MKVVKRNDPCHCGSGKKYKNCHGKKSTAGALSSQWIYLPIGVIVVTGVVIIFGRSSEIQPGTAPPGKVWSPEHEHWHDAPSPAGGASAQPPGQAPPGKVWSPEHRHWHDAPLPQAEGKPLTPQPPGPAPPGKVWSPEHGHWHDAR